jgi:hypothetical protein
MFRGLAPLAAECRCHLGGVTPLVCRLPPFPPLPCQEERKGGRERKERICPTSPSNDHNVTVEAVDHGGIATGGCCSEGVAAAKGGGALEGSPARTRGANA